MEYYEQDGQIGILVSPGCGAGWSTWGTKELAFDKRIVNFWLAHKDDEEFLKTVEIGPFFGKESEAHKTAATFFKEIGYDDCPCLGGFSQIELEFVPRGVPWMISEYDGYETLRTAYSDEFTVF